MIFTYWQGPMSDFQKACIDSIRRHNPGFVVYRPADVALLPGGQDVLDFALPLPVPQKSDLIRLFIMKLTGGTWVDADTICLGRIDLENYARNRQLVGVYNTLTPSARNGLTSTPFYIAPEAPIASQMFTECWDLLELMKQGTHIPYGATSVGLLSKMWREQPQNIVRLQHWKYNPVHWKKARKVFMAPASLGRHEFGRHYTPNRVCYHLTNPVTSAFAETPLAELRTGYTFAEFLLQKAFNWKKSMPGRSWEIFQRIKDIESPVVVEIGVDRGNNARRLLWSKHDLNMILVDPYRPLNRLDYLATDDYHAHRTQEQFNQIRIQMVKRLTFAENRCYHIRKTSFRAHSEVPDGSVDLVFIDGDHSYSAVQQELVNWYSKVKPGGWIGGHDYNLEQNQRKNFGVVQAVNEWALANLRTITEGEDTTWWTQKPV